MRLNRILLFIIFFCQQLSAQEIIQSRDYPKDFRYPLDIKPSLAGSFGEIRSNHFHSGLDFRTNQREGYPVYAVADGYISRLRVQIGGFGYAVYINHPNGYTSVYAHLQRFNQRITQTVKDLQYRRQSFDVDFPLPSFEIPVKKGDIIAWSGNTGGSAGPHLHFELRDSKTEETINPQLFGFRVADNVKPAITALYLYRLGNVPFSERTPSQYFQLTGSGGNYVLNQRPVINLSGNAGFGITTFDQQIAGGNKNGVYSIELLLDGKLIYSSALERFAFENSRAINSHIDFPALKQFGRTVQKSFIEPGNPLRIYRNVENNGIVNLNDDSIHNVEYVVKDVAGNTSRLKFQIRRNLAASLSPPEPTGLKVFSFSDSSSYVADRMKISIPKGTLYSDIYFRYSTGNRPGSAFSVVHNIHTGLIPLHKNYHLWIKPDIVIPDYLRDKAVIVDTRGACYGGNYEEGFIKASPRNFGSFLIKLDTIAPTIRPIDIADGKNMASASKVTFRISDNLSGIRTFRGTIDGQWVLFEFDPKRGTAWHTFENNLAQGKHLLQFSVTDLKNNTKTYNAIFYR